MRKKGVRYGLGFFMLFGALALILCSGAWADQKSLAVMKFTTTAGGGTNYGSFTDKFGIGWMVNCSKPKK